MWAVFLGLEIASDNEGEKSARGRSRRKVMARRGLLVAAARMGEMRNTLVPIVSLLSLTAACIPSSMLVSAQDAVFPPTAMGAVPVATGKMIEMPPVVVDGRVIYGRMIKRASADATALCARELDCPAVRVRRADHYVREDGTPWTVVRLNACGEDRVYEKTLEGWKDATSRLR